MSTKLLLKTLSDISIPKSHIINKSFDSCRVPDQLNIVTVIPIYKASDPNRLQNYRPISLLPALSPLIEKCLSFLRSKILYMNINLDFEQNSPLYIL